MAPANLKCSICKKFPQPCPQKTCREAIAHLARESDADSTVPTLNLAHAPACTAGDSEMAQTLGDSGSQLASAEVEPAWAVEFEPENPALETSEGSSESAPMHPTCVVACGAGGSPIQGDSAHSEGHAAVAASDDGMTSSDDEEHEENDLFGTDTVLDDFLEDVRKDDVILEMFDNVRNLCAKDAVKAKFRLERAFSNGSLPLDFERSEHRLSYEQVLRDLGESAVTPLGVDSAAIPLTNKRSECRIPDLPALEKAKANVESSLLACCLHAWAGVLQWRKEKIAVCLKSLNQGEISESSWRHGVTRRIEIEKARWVRRRETLRHIGPRCREEPLRATLATLLARIDQMKTLAETAAKVHADRFRRKWAWYAMDIVACQIPGEGVHYMSRYERDLRHIANVEKLLKARQELRDEIAELEKSGFDSEEVGLMWMHLTQLELVRSTENLLKFRTEVADRVDKYHSARDTKGERHEELSREIRDAFVEESRLAGELVQARKDLRVAHSSLDESELHVKTLTRELEQGPPLKRARREGTAHAEPSAMPGDPPCGAAAKMLTEEQRLKIAENRAAAKAIQKRRQSDVTATVILTDEHRAQIAKRRAEAIEKQAKRKRCAEAAPWPSLGA